jgi:hypothetical protein
VQYKQKQAHNQRVVSPFREGNHGKIIRTCLTSCPESVYALPMSQQASLGRPSPKQTTTGPPTSASSVERIRCLHHRVSWRRIQARRNSIQSIRPSPSWSASLIISSTSSSVNFSPMEVITWRSSAAEMNPLLSRSKTCPRPLVFVVPSS